MKPALSSLALLSLLVMAPANDAAAAQRTVASQDSVSADPVLRAMQVEMERSKAQLKLEGVQAPYYIDYRLTDVDDFTAEASFGALRNQTRQRLRLIRVVVRVGDYKQDSYYGAGEGTIELGPLDDDLQATRHQLWLATDRAYKAASETLTSKQSQLKQLSIDQPVDDFAHAPVLESIAPVVRLDFDPPPWVKTLEEASALYRTDPQVQSLDTRLKAVVTNRYFVSSEGTVVRGGAEVCYVLVAATTQAADGMRLERSRGDEATDIRDLPSKEKLLASTSELLASLKNLREAPLAEEDYHGPVLLLGDAAASVVASLVGPNVLGRRPPIGQNARTIGAWASSYKSRVLPDFLSVFDDPTISSFEGHPLLGSYPVDDEGVKATLVPVIEKGQLINYLVGRQPIRDFPGSNGHGRANPMGAPTPNLGNLILQSSEPVSDEQLKSKLIELCRQRDLPYGYLVKTLGPRLAPRLLYRLWTKDGRMELVRGAIFGDLDARALRSSLIAAGKTAAVESRLEPVPQSIVSPALLFDELEIKRADASKEKLPDYPAPSLTTPK